MRIIKGKIAEPRNDWTGEKECDYMVGRFILIEDIRNKLKMMKFHNKIGKNDTGYNQALEELEKELIGNEMPKL